MNDDCVANVDGLLGAEPPCWAKGLLVVEVSTLGAPKENPDPELDDAGFEKGKEPVVDGLGGSSLALNEKAELVGVVAVCPNPPKAGLFSSDDDEALNENGLDGEGNEKAPPSVGLGSAGFPFAVTSLVGLSSILSPESWLSLGGVTARESVAGAGTPKTNGLLVSALLLLSPNENREAVGANENEVGLLSVA